MVGPINRCRGSKSPMAIAVTCSGCNTRWQVRDELAGSKVQCPKCDTPIAVGNRQPSTRSSPRTTSQSRVGSTSPSDLSSTRFQNCPQCGKQLSSPEEKCGHCGGVSHDPWQRVADALSAVKAQKSIAFGEPEAASEQNSPNRAETPTASHVRHSSVTDVGYRVDIAARTIRWPAICACCSQPTDTSVEVSSTKEKGVQVVRRHTKSWQVPYCHDCLSHVKAFVELNEFLKRPTDWVGSGVHGLLWCCDDRFLHLGSCHQYRRETDPGSEG